MQKVAVPEYPETPKHSPVHDEEKRNDRNLRGSIYGGDESVDEEEVTAIKMEEHKSSTQELYRKWNKFLNEEEEIVMGFVCTLSVPRNL